MNLAQWIFIQNSTTVESYLECDPDSVMMYKELGIAAKARGLPSSGHSAKAHYLSNTDVRAIKYMYPAPPPPAPPPPVFQSSVVPGIPWDHHLLVTGFSSLPKTYIRDRLTAGNEITFLMNLRRFINKNQYAAQHGGLQIFVTGPADDTWRKVVNTVLSESQWFYKNRRYILEVIPIKDTKSGQTEVLFYAK